MKKLPTEMDYAIKVPFNIAKGGEMIEAQKLTVRAPTNRVYKEVFFIQQEIRKSELKTVESFKDFIDEDTLQQARDRKADKIANAPDEESAELDVDPDTVVQTLMAGHGDIEGCIDALLRIIVGGKDQYPNCMIDDSTRMTRVIFDDMSPIDTQGLLGAYIVNFISASQTR